MTDAQIGEGEKERGSSLSLFVMLRRNQSIILCLVAERLAIAYHLLLSSSSSFLLLVIDSRTTDSRPIRTV